MENTNELHLDGVGETKDEAVLETVKNETRPQKNEMAVALGKLRWANKSDAERKAHMTMMSKIGNKKRWAKVKESEELEISFAKLP